MYKLYDTKPYSAHHDEQFLCTVPSTLKSGLGIHSQTAIRVICVGAYFYKIVLQALLTWQIIQARDHASKKYVSRL